jgi:hypothetical protein
MTRQQQVFRQTSEGETEAMTQATSDNGESSKWFFKVGRARFHLRHLAVME